MTVILASQSPRRQELLHWLMDDFEIQPADINEDVKDQYAPKDYVMEMARQKAAVVAEEHSKALVIASDTVVVLDNQILGKPKDREEAFGMLKGMSGGSHLVYTSVVLRKEDRLIEELSSAIVTFYDLTDDEINRYLDSDDYKDKAGAYGIQNGAGVFVEKIEGDYYSIVGFPVGLVNQMLKKI